MIDDSIIISSINYDGELARVLFKPDNDDITINLGIVELPFLFEPFLLTPPREVYGTYTILTFDPECNNILQVPRPTSTPTPTPTPTKTVTPTPTPTITPTPSPDPCKIPSPTPTPTSTITPTPTISITPTPTPSYNPCGFYPGPPSSTPTNTPTNTPTMTPNYNPCLK